MSETIDVSGSCLCGKTAIHSSDADRHFEACHCGMCRNWAGSPAMVIRGGSNVAIEGEEYVQIFESSDWAERGFCRVCGTHLFYRLKESMQYMLPVGLFGTVDSFVFEKEIYVDSKPDFYCFGNEVEKLTEEEVEAQFADGDATAS